MTPDRPCPTCGTGHAACAAGANSGPGVRCCSRCAHPGDNYGGEILGGPRDGEWLVSSSPDAMVVNPPLPPEVVEGEDGEYGLSWSDEPLRFERRIWSPGDGTRPPLWVTPEQQADYIQGYT